MIITLIKNCSFKTQLKHFSHIEKDNYTIFLIFNITKLAVNYYGKNINVLWEISSNIK